MGIYGCFPGSFKSLDFVPTTPRKCSKSLPQVVTSAHWEERCGAVTWQPPAQCLRGAGPLWTLPKAAPKTGGLVWKPFPTVDATSINLDNSYVSFPLLYVANLWRNSVGLEANGTSWGGGGDAPSRKWTLGNFLSQKYTEDTIIFNLRTTLH